MPRRSADEQLQQDRYRDPGWIFANTQVNLPISVWNIHDEVEHERDHGFAGCGHPGQDQHQSLPWSELAEKIKEMFVQKHPTINDESLHSLHSLCNYSAA